MMIELFKKNRREKPAYLDRIDQLEMMEIVRLQGKIDQTTIPAIEARIQENRRAGDRIDKHIVLDFLKVDHVDSATIAFHIFHLKEYQDNGFRVGFINITHELRILLNMFKENDHFKVYASEAEAVKDLNR